MTNQDLTFKTITTGLRPARCTVFVKRDDPDWMDTCLRIIECTTAEWGGWYSLLVPTDGTSIDPLFMGLIGRFDADYYLQYHKTGADLKIAQPERFAEWVESETQKFLAQNPNAEESFCRKEIEGILQSQNVVAFDIKASLAESIFSKFTPFHRKEDDRIHWLSARLDHIPFRACAVTNLLPFLPRPVRVIDIQLDASPHVQLLAHSICGKLWPGLVTFHGGDVSVQAEHHTSDDVRPLFDDLWDMAPKVWQHYPMSLSVAGCDLYLPVEINFRMLPPVVVTGDSLEDFCLYFALHRMRGNAYWLPKTLIDTYNARLGNGGQDHTLYRPGEELLVAHLLQHLRWKKENDRPILTSLSIVDSDLEPIAEFIGDIMGRYQGDEADSKPEIQRDIAALLPGVRRLYDRHNVDRRYRDQFHRGESVNFVDTPKPKNLTSVPPVDVSWITDLRIEGYHVPRIAPLAPETLRIRNYDTGEVRITNDGFAYFCPNIFYVSGDIDSVLVRPTLHLQADLELFAQVFKRANLHVRLSDKGSYHLECIARFGSLEAFANFLAADLNRRLLDLYLYQGKSESGRGDKIRDRRYLDFLSIRNIVQTDSIVAAAADEAAIKTKEALADDVDVEEQEKQAEAASSKAVNDATVRHIDDLIRKRVLHRGFVFKCEVCRNLDWYTVDEVGSEFWCARCRTGQVYTVEHWIMPEEPSWCFQLDEIIYQAYRNDIHVPALCLRALQTRSKSAFLYLPESELLRTPTAKKQELEIDFCCCLDGQTMIGEAKKADRLENTETKERSALEKYRDLARAVNAQNVVLSTFEESWSARTTILANEVLGPMAVLMTRADLLPS